MDNLPDGLLDRFELWRDVRRGHAGLPARAALSLTAALVLLAGAMLVLGLMEQSSYVRDEHVAIALGLASVLWFVALIKIWATYNRFRNVLKTIFGILAIWAVAIPLGILADEIMRGGEEFVIAACILTAIGGSILLITSTAHRVRRGTRRASEHQLPLLRLLHGRPARVPLSRMRHALHAGRAALQTRLPQHRPTRLNAATERADSGFSSGAAQPRPTAASRRLPISERSLGPRH